MSQSWVDPLQNSHIRFTTLLVMSEANPSPDSDNIAFSLEVLTGEDFYDGKTSKPDFDWISSMGMGSWLGAVSG